METMAGSGVDLATLGEGVCLSVYNGRDGDMLFFGGSVVGVLEGLSPDFGDPPVTEAGRFVMTRIGD